MATRGSAAEPTSAEEEKEPPGSLEGSEGEEGEPPEKGTGGACRCLVSAVGEEKWGITDVSRSAFMSFMWEPQRSRPTRALGVFRVAAAAYWCAWVLTSSLGTTSYVHLRPPVYSAEDAAEYWIIYVSDWTALLLCAYLLCACLVLPPWPHDAWLRAACRLTWALRTTALTATLIVSVLYWTMLFPFTLVTSVADVHIHGVSSVLCVADLLCCAVPFRLRHAYLPLAYVAAYVAFSLVYFACGGVTETGSPALYPFLDYRDLASTLPALAGVVLVVLPMVHTALWAIRRAAWERWGRGDDLEGEMGRFVASPPQGRKGATLGWAWGSFRSDGGGERATGLSPTTDTALLEEGGARD